MALGRSLVEDPRRLEFFWPAGAIPIEARVFNRLPECSVRLRGCDTGHPCPACSIEQVLVVSHLSCLSRSNIAALFILRSAIEDRNGARFLAV